MAEVPERPTSSSLSDRGRERLWKVLMEAWGYGREAVPADDVPTDMALKAIDALSTHGLLR